MGTPNSTLHTQLFAKCKRFSPKYSIAILCPSGQLRLRDDGAGSGGISQARAQTALTNPPSTWTTRSLLLEGSVSAYRACYPSVQRLPRVIMSYHTIPSCGSFDQIPINGSRHCADRYVPLREQYDVLGG